VRILEYGDSALLVELGGLSEVMTLDHQLRGAVPAGVIDIVPAARTVLVRFDPQIVGRQQITSWIAGRTPDGDESSHSLRSPALPGDATVIPVHYDGEDLAAVAATCGLSPEGVIALHTQALFTVAFCGFAPGFGYLTGTPEQFRVPRRASPRTRVPAGSVALADEFSAVYPQESPGGWQLIGRTDVVVFDVDRNPPALLTPGTRVRFVEAGR
jgi:KipI family sensor histidine kinase inhibitor